MSHFKLAGVSAPGGAEPGEPHATAPRRKSSGAPPLSKKSGLRPRQGGTLPASYQHEYVRLLKRGCWNRTTGIGGERAWFSRTCRCTVRLAGRFWNHRPSQHLSLELARWAGRAGAKRREKCGAFIARWGEAAPEPKTNGRRRRGAFPPVTQRPSGESLAAKPPPAAQALRVGSRRENSP